MKITMRRSLGVVIGSIVALIAGLIVSAPAAQAAAPPAPTITTIGSTSQAFAVSFTQPGNGGSTITSYQYRLGSSGTWGNAPGTSSPLAITTDPDTGLSLVNDTSYNVQIRAVNVDGDGAVSNTVTAVPGGAPDAPTLGSVTPGNAQLSIPVTAGAGNGGASLTNYMISTDGGSTYTARTPASTASPLVITGLTNGTAYNVRVKAVNAAANQSSQSNQVSGTPFTSPSAPTIGTITPGNGQLSVAFTAPSSNGGSGITTYQYSLDGGAWNNRQTGTTASPVVITGLTNGTSYSVRLRAVTAAVPGGGAASTPASGTPATTAAAPTITSSTAGLGSVSLGFTAPSSTGGLPIQNYEFRYKTTGTGDGTYTPWAVRQTGSTASPLVVTNLNYQEEYTFQIRAVTASGTGTASAAYDAVTTIGLPDAPVINGGTTTASNGQISVGFSVADDGGSPIQVIQYQLNGGAWVNRATGTYESPLLITGLTNGTAYSVKLRTVTAFGTSDASGSVSRMPSTNPGAPTLKSVTSGTSQQLAVAYTAPANNGGIAITRYQYQLNSGPWFDASPATGGTFNIGSLINGNSYTVNVRAVNGNGQVSPASNAITRIPGTAPGAPTIGLPMATLVNGQVVVPYTAGSTGGAAITNYEYQLDGGAWVTPSPASISNPLMINGLTNAQTYSIKIRAVNAAGLSGAASGAASVKPLGQPSAPSITSVGSGVGSLTVNFNAPTNDGGLPVDMYQYQLNGGAWVNRSTGTTGSPFTISGLSRGTYTVKIRAVSVLGNGNASTAVSAETVGNPSAPTATGVTNGSNKVSVKFTAPSYKGGSAINKYQYRINSGSWKNRKTGTTGSPLTITGLKNGKTYKIQLRAVNAKGYVGSASNTIVGRPATKPSAPTITNTKAATTSVRLYFQKPSDNGSQSIVRYQYQLNGGSWVNRKTGTTGSPLKVTGLKKNKTYKFRIRAVNKANLVGKASNQVTVKTLKS